MQKKIKISPSLLYTIALGLGILMVIMGIVFLFWSEDHCSVTGGLSRASTSVQFGADFYTTSAQNSALAANTLTDLFKLVKFAVAVFCIFFGGLDVCYTAFKLFAAETKDKPGDDGRNVQQAEAESKSNENIAQNP